MTTKSDHWRSDLDELLTVCERRAGRARALPHCAICARYSEMSPAFEAILSILETMPQDQLAEALGEARRRLAPVPATLLSQQVGADTFGVLLESPGWPLVRHLIIDMANEATARHLPDRRLDEIEELTLLGFAYGNATAGTNFTRALLGSALDSVRVLKLHSADFADEDRTAFWTSPFTSRLKRIEGATYRGEALPHTLQVEELSLRGSWDAIERPDDVLRLLVPGATPLLRKLNLGSYYAEGAAPAFLRLVDEHRATFERIDEVSFSIYGRSEEAQRLLAAANLPKTVRSVSWSWHSTHGTIFSFDGEIHNVYCPDKGDRVTGIDSVTHYPNFVAELANVGDLSRGLKELKVIAPPAVLPEEIVAAVQGFPALEQLSLVYPFTEAQLSGFLRATQHLSRTELYLTMQTGGSTTEYIKHRADGYRSDVTARGLLELALAAREVSFYADPLDVTRTPSGIEHLTLKTPEAILALAEIDPAVAIEALTFETTLTTETATALKNSNVLSRVHRLALRQGLSEDAAAILAEVPQLREVRDFSLAGYRSITPQAFKRLIDSPYLCGVLDLSLWTVPEGGDVALSQSFLLPSVVTLDVHGCEDTAVLPASGRLTRLRHISEWLTMYVLEDGTLARQWLASGAAVPLIARLRAFADWVFRVPEAPLPDLIASLPADRTDENGARDAIRDLIAGAFKGEPIPEGKTFADLTEGQQTALKAVVGVDDYFWCVGGLLSPVFKSYGLPPFQRENLEQYIAGKQKDA